MKKVVIHKPGGYTRLQVEEHPDPKPGKGEVLVEVKAAGVNYADCAVRWGLYESAKKFVGWPITPGFEFAGVVEAVGDDAGEWKAGDEVFGVSFFGAYASKLVVPAHQVF
ncbi:MAG: alcohol dehydrogenase catalytic domain-containing protein, partial [Bacteroidota bacterium]